MTEVYELLDSGHGKKLERLGPVTLIRPCAQAIWNPTLPKENWKKADWIFSREGKNQWLQSDKKLSQWEVEIEGLRFLISPTSFGHLGIFPEHRSVWKWLLENTKPKMKVLNLFAYSGGATLAAAKAGAQVVHLDAAKGMIDWAKENAQKNDLSNAPIRWIIDDAKKFLKREERRESQYEGIILDPPTFGRGPRGEVFKIENELPALLHLCNQLLSKQAKFLILTCHTPGYTATVLKAVLGQVMKGRGGTITGGELLLESSQSLSIPHGYFARWENE